MNTNTCNGHERSCALNFALPLACLLILLLQGQPVAVAQPAERFQSLDSNGDGRISREEFIGGNGLFFQAGQPSVTLVDCPRMAWRDSIYMA